jgi:hypothetical protein
MREAPLWKSDPEALARARELCDRQLSKGEFCERLQAPLLPGEIEDTRALIEWFCRRYPTPADRLAYVRRAYRRWVKARMG